ncbi:tetratricopeptide repeat protein [Novosphingobium sp. ZN18A2]|uniref:tetratricopeptide repeat protein n=1 Tax=Novosphingobium sp. ZN18A2 TaxID=3079861 RepID=UPI0030D23E87
MALGTDKKQSRKEEIAKRKELQQDVFMREVDDALREDQMMDALKRYGIPVGVLVLAGLIALGGYLWYNNHQVTQANTRGEELVQSLDSIDASNFKDGEAKLQPLAKTDGGYAAAADLLEGGIAEQQGKAADASKAFAAVAADKTAPQAYRDLATIREVSANFDKMKPEDVVSRLKPLAVPGNPWFGSAGELVGVAYMKQGKNDLAGPLFASISKDKDVPETLRRRARQLAGLLGVDAIEDPGKAAARGIGQEPTE